VNEWVVREYFEALGYLVTQPRKYEVPARRKKRADEEIDLLVVNPAVRESAVPEHMVWSTADLAGVGRAVVGVRGWHTDRFYVSTFERSPEILRFAAPEPTRSAERRLGKNGLVKILCLPKLPQSGELKRKSTDVLKARGIDGVISFETILAELIARVDVHRNYEKSDLLQIMRLLKNYGLLRDPQLELFGRKRR
jgi:hypothetical protein